jgi:hypothetical protein
MLVFNDVGWPGTILVPKGEPAPTAEEIITGYRQAHRPRPPRRQAHLGATLRSFEGQPPEGYYDEAKEAKRQAVNKRSAKAARSIG